jgi:hypothetical protein
MKIAHIQVRMFVSKPNFFTNSQSTSTAFGQREISACMPCRYHSLSCSFLSPAQNDGPRFHLLYQSGIKWPPPSRSHLGISEIVDDARNGFLGVSQSNTKPIEKPFFFELLVRFEAEGVAFYPGSLSPSYWTGDTTEQDKEWYRQGMHALVSRWRKTVEVDGDWKNRVWRQISSLQYVLFSWFLINIYCGKTWGIAFWATHVCA